MPRSEKNKYPLFACHDWVIENIYTIDETVENDINREKLLRERAKRIQDEIKAEQMAGIMVPRDQAMHWLSDIIGEVRQALFGLPRRLAASLLAKTDERDIETELRSEIKRILWSLASPLEKNRRKGKKRAASAGSSAHVEASR